jgi:hypothetical protein
MQPINKLMNTLEALACAEHYLFKASDFRVLFAGTSQEALRVLLGRAVKAGLLKRICNGIYLYPRAAYPRGYELYHTAARLRENVFCYLSMESILSEAGIISQIPLNWIVLKTGGRSGIIDCGDWGHIEFIHTKKRPEHLSSFLNYDYRYKLWRAEPELALRDMRNAKRSMDLIDWEAAHEFI